MARFIVLYDSCVIYSAPLRDLFMRLALTDLYQAKWTQEIHKEWMRNLLKNRPDLKEERLESIRSKMDLHVRDCLVEGYEELIEGLKLPDANDRHILAAAIKASAQTIVTYNLSDFPSSILSKYEIDTQHPDEFLRHLIDLAPAIVIKTVQETRLSLKNPPKDSGEYLAILEKQSLPQTVQTPLMDSEQMNVLRRSAADKYRKQHHLLTSEEIIKYRASLGMSQAAFANYLKVGEASIKRWETYFVQDVVQDDHIRLKCDEAYAELNALEVHWKSHSSDIYSGNRLFCLELFKQAVRYLIGFTKSPLFLNKALFYADFKHFQEQGMSITGARYVHLEYGPCPDQFQNIYQLFLSKGVLISGGHHILKSVEKPDLSVFSDSEKKILEFVAQIAHKDGGKSLLKVSHEEQAFKKTEPLQLISYAFSKNLKI